LSETPPIPRGPFGVPPGLPFGGSAGLPFGGSAGLALVLASVFAGLAGCRGEERHGHSALLVSLDTTRADALGTYGSSNGATPRLDGLAAESVCYERAHTVAPLTLPSHASMWTGLYPPRHSVRDNGLWPLPESARTVAEVASEAGVQTAAFVAAVVLDERYGLAQGFDVYAGPEPRDLRQVNIYEQLPAREVVDRAIAWLGTRDRERPFLLWVHLFDPHAPYAALPEFQGLASGSGGPYAAEIAAADRAIGRLFDALRADGSWDDTFVAFVADHGEAFGEHGEVRHGANGYQTTIRVPFLLRHPDGWRAGERTEEVVSLVDLAPTLLDALGVDASQLDSGGAGAVDGRSLFRSPGAAEPRGAYFETYAGYLSFGYSPLAGWVDAEGKYVHSSSPQFFDLRSDPDEATDRIAQTDERTLARYREAIGRVADAPALSADSGAIDTDLRDDVRALGYGAFASPEALPHPLAPSDRPSPAESAEAHQATLQAMDYVVSGMFDRALPILRRLVASHPEHYVALENLGVVLLRLGRHEEAIAPLRELLRNRPELPDTQYNLGLALLRSNRLEESADAFERALALDPDRASFHAPLIDVLGQLGRTEEQARWQERLRALQDGAR